MQYRKLLENNGFDFFSLCVCVCVCVCVIYMHIFRGLGWGGGATIGLLVRRGMGNYSTLILNKKWNVKQYSDPR